MDRAQQNGQTCTSLEMSYTNLLKRGSDAWDAIRLKEFAGCTQATDEEFTGVKSRLKLPASVFVNLKTAASNIQAIVEQMNVLVPSMFNSGELQYFRQPNNASYHLQEQKLIKFSEKLQQCSGIPSLRIKVVTGFYLALRNSLEQSSDAALDPFYNLGKQTREDMLKQLNANAILQQEQDLNAIILNIPDEMDFDEDHSKLLVQQLDISARDQQFHSYKEIMLQWLRENGSQCKLITLVLALMKSHLGRVMSKLLPTCLSNPPDIKRYVYSLSLDNLNEVMTFLGYTDDYVEVKALKNACASASYLKAEMFLRICRFPDCQGDMDTIIQCLRTECCLTQVVPAVPMPAHVLPPSSQAMGAMNSAQYFNPTYVVINNYGNQDNKDIIGDVLQGGATKYNQRAIGGRTQLKQQSGEQQQLKSTSQSFYQQNGANHSTLITELDNPTAPESVQEQLDTDTLKAGNDCKTESTTDSLNSSTSSLQEEAAPKNQTQKLQGTHAQQSVQVVQSTPYPQLSTPYPQQIRSNTESASLNSHQIQPEFDGNKFLYHCMFREWDMVDALLASTTGPIPIKQQQCDETSGKNAFQYICASGNHDRVKTMISRGANLTQVDAEGLSVLHYKEVLQDMKLLTLLLQQKGLSVDIATQTHHLTPLSKAINDLGESAISVAELFLKYHASPDGHPKAHSRPLNLSCQLGSLKLVKLLVAYKADVNAQDEERNTPLLAACKSSRWEVANFLLDQPLVKVNLSDKCGTTPLFESVSKCQYEFVERLLRRKAPTNCIRHVSSPKVAGFMEESPLAHACARGFISIVEILLKYGADINFKCANTAPPIVFAVLGRKINIVEFLLKRSDLDKSLDGLSYPIIASVNIERYDITKTILDCLGGAQQVLAKAEQFGLVDLKSHVEIFMACYSQDGGMGNLPETVSEQSLVRAGGTGPHWGSSSYRSSGLRQMGMIDQDWEEKARTEDLLRQFCEICMKVIREKFNLSELADVTKGLSMEVSNFFRRCANNTQPNEMIKADFLGASRNVSPLGFLSEQKAINSADFVAQAIVYFNGEPDQYYEDLIRCFHNIPGGETLPYEIQSVLNRLFSGQFSLNCFCGVQSYPADFRTHSLPMSPHSRRQISLSENSPRGPHYKRTDDEVRPKPAILMQESPQARSFDSQESSEGYVSDASAELDSVKHSLRQQSLTDIDRDYKNANVHAKVSSPYYKQFSNNRTEASGLQSSYAATSVAPVQSTMTQSSPRFNMPASVANQGGIKVTSHLHTPEQAVKQKTGAETQTKANSLNSTKRSKSKAKGVEQYPVEVKPRSTTPSGKSDTTTTVYASAACGPGLEATRDLGKLRSHLKDVKYLEESLGDGAFGHVEIVEYKGKQYAAKVLRQNCKKEDRHKMLERYNTEYEVLSKLSHRNIVEYIGVAFKRGVDLPLLIMEKLETDLHQFLEANQGLSREMKLTIMLDTASGLHFLHNNKPAVIHRDLTAKNVLMDANNVAKITDFGNSRIVHLDPSEMYRNTMTGNPGTLVYTAPEAQKSRPKYGSAIDIFSYGHLAIFIINQVFPNSVEEPTYFDDEGRLQGRSEVERRETDFQKLRETLSSDHDQSIIRLVERCLHNHPNKRPTAGDIIGILAQSQPHSLKQVNSQKTNVDSGTDIDSHQSPPGQGDNSETYPRDWTGLRSNILNPKEIVYPRVPECLGFGRYGSVEVVIYREKEHAAKSFRKDFRTSEDQRAAVIKKFTAEFNILSCLKHRNIVEFVGATFKPGHDLPLLIMEKLKTNLQKFLETNSGLPLRLKLSILYDTVNGLHFLHTRRPNAVIHRDITATNVLLDMHNRAKLADFGNSCIIDVDVATTVSMTCNPGTLLYSAPEATSRDYGIPIDIFSFGHLALITIIQYIPMSILPAVKISDNGEITVHTEFERRVEHFEILYEYLEQDHIVTQMIKQCLHNGLMHRPTAHNILGILAHSLIQKQFNSQQTSQVTNLKDHPVPQREEISNGTTLSDFDSEDFDEIVTLLKVKYTSKLLGKGAYGQVEIVEHNGKQYAAKFVRSAYNDDHKHKVMKRCRNELKVLSNLKHKNIVGYIGVAKKEGHDFPILVMEMMENNLHGLLKNNEGLQMDKKLSILRDIANGLLYLHTSIPAIIHGDLTAKNVLLDSNFVAKIADFGSSIIIKFFSEVSRSSTFLAGTLAYMAPEYTQQECYGIEIDVFSFGVLAIFTVNQKFPDHLEPPSYHDMKGVIQPRTELQRRHVHMKELYNILPEDHNITHLIQRCLHNVPHQRPTAQDLLVTLEKEVEVYKVTDIIFHNFMCSHNIKT